MATVQQIVQLFRDRYICFFLLQILIWSLNYSEKDILLQILSAITTKWLNFLDPLFFLKLQSGSKLVQLFRDRHFIDISICNFSDVKKIYRSAEFSWHFNPEPLAEALLCTNCPSLHFLHHTFIKNSSFSQNFSHVYMLYHDTHILGSTM